MVLYDGDDSEEISRYTDPLQPQKRHDWRERLEMFEANKTLEGSLDYYFKKMYDGTPLNPMNH